MEAIVLGSGPGMPQADRNLSSLLLRNEDKLILADCGDGCTRRLIEHGIAADDIDAVLISHYHPDHVSGIFMLMQMLYLMGRRKPLYLFLPERPDIIGQILQMMYTFSQKFAFELHLLPMEDLGNHYSWIKAVTTDHLYGYSKVINEHSLLNTMKSWSFRFSAENGDLVYTSDLATTDCIVEILKGAHTVIVDAGHPAAEQILKLKHLNIERIILTHGVSQELENRKAELDNTLFEFAKEDHVYSV